MPNPRPRRPRVDRLGSQVHPTVRFFWGLGLLGCLVFAGDWVPRGILLILGFALAVSSGKRVSLSYFGFLIATVVLFNLFVPEGRVWMTLGPVPITEGAFFLGLGKGFTFSGLVFFSLASISRGLRLPGRLGALWGQTFAWYEQLMDQRKALKPRALLMSIDRLLERLYPTRPGHVLATAPEVKASPPTTGWGWALVAVTLGSAVAVVALVP